MHQTDCQSRAGSVGQTGQCRESVSTPEDAATREGVSLCGSLRRSNQVSVRCCRLKASDRKANTTDRRPFVEGTTTCRLAREPLPKSPL